MLFTGVSSHYAQASSCFTSLLIDHEFRELVKIARENKLRREEIMESHRDDRPLLVKRHLLQAILYEEKKSRIYIAMLEKLLQQRSPFQKTTLEIKRRLLRSLSFYEQFKESLVEIEGFEERPIDAPMSERVAKFLWPEDS